MLDGVFDQGLLPTCHSPCGRLVDPALRHRVMRALAPRYDNTIRRDFFSAVFICVLYKQPGVRSEDNSLS